MFYIMYWNFIGANNCDQDLRLNFSLIFLKNVFTIKLFHAYVCAIVWGSEENWIANSCVEEEWRLAEENKLAAEHFLKLAF